MESKANTPDEFSNVRLTDYLRFIRERWWIVVVLIVVLVGATWYVSNRKTPLYSTSAQVIHQVGGWEQTLLGVDYYTYYGMKIPVDAQLLASPDMAARVQAMMGSERSPDQLLGMISARPVTETETIVVSATGADPAETAAVANAFAQAFVDSRREQMENSLASAKSMLQEQIRAIPSAELQSASALNLQERLRQLETLTDLVSSDYRVLRTAAVPGAPFTPKPLRDSLLAFGIALIGGIALAFLFEFLDKRIKDEPAMERAFRYPVLVTIPAVRRSAWRRDRDQNGTSGPPPGVGFLKGQTSLLEPFMLLRSNLKYFGVDEPIHSVMVTSSLPRQGKTTVSINLALAMALAGERVVLVECDMRRPRLHVYLDLDNKVGLSSVLAGTADLNQAIQTVKVSDLVAQSAKKDHGQSRSGKILHVITSGPVPPNPGELTSSKRMSMLIKTLAWDIGYDCAIVDTAPALLVADPLVIAPNVDGVILAARMRATKTGEAARLRALLDNAGARVLGLVVSNDRRGRAYYGYGHGYGYGYGRYGSEYGYGPEGQPDQPVGSSPDS